MKKIIILFFLVLFVESLNAQVARVQSCPSITNIFGSGSISENNELHEFHIRYTPTQSYVQYNVFDQTGKVLKIESIPVNGNLYQAQLTGVFRFSTDRVILYTVHKKSSGSSLIVHELLEINTSTNSFVQSTVLDVGDLIRNIGPTLKIGGQYVSYVVEQNVGFKRIAVEESDFTVFSEELIDNSAATVATYTNRNIGFTYDGINEYTFYSKTNRAYKRIAANNYSYSAYLFANNMNVNVSIAVGNNRVLVTKKSEYNLLDGDLNILMPVNFLITTSEQNLSCVYKDNHFYVMSQGNFSKLSKYNSTDMTLIDESLLLIKMQYNDFRLVNGKLAFSAGCEGDYFSRLSSNGELLTETIFFYTVSFLVDRIGEQTKLLDISAKINAKDFNFVSGQAVFPSTEIYDSPIRSIHSNIDPTVPLVYSSSNIFSAKNQNNIVATDSRYANLAFQIGPYTDSADYSSEIQSNYSRIYWVTKEMIGNHLQALQSGIQNYTPEFGIREWPAHGNTALGQSANLAPFFDDNSNGIYEPLLRDYPLIYGDECSFSIGHCSKGTPSSPEIELHSYRFRFYCDSNDAVANTVFMKNVYIARGLDLDSVFVTTYMDGDLGIAYDDYAGTHVGLGLVYNYNGNLSDQPTNNSTSSFGNHIPAFGYIQLQGVKQMPDLLDNSFGVYQNESINGRGFGDGIVDNEYFGLTSSLSPRLLEVYPYHSPYQIPDFFISAKGLYLDGSPKGMEGLPNSPGIPIKHWLYGNSDPLFYASEGVDHGNNQFDFQNGAPDDIRSFASSGPGQLYIGDTLVTFGAFIYARDTNSTTILDPVNKLFSKATEVKSFFENNSVGCNSSFEPLIVVLSNNEKQIDNIKIYPNPTQSKFYITGMEGKSELTLMDMKGTVLFQNELVESQFEIDLSRYSEGLYFIRIANSKGFVLKKVVKN